MVMAENEFARFWVEDGILFFVFKPRVIIDHAAAKMIVADRLQVQMQKSYPILCDISMVFEINKGARDYFALHSYLLIDAVAIVTRHNKLSFSMISFYLKVYKPKAKTEVFSDRESALKFLTEFI